MRSGEGVCVVLDDKFNAEICAFLYRLVITISVYSVSAAILVIISPACKV